MNERIESATHAAVIPFTPGAEQRYRDRGITVVPWPLAPDPRIARIEALCNEADAWNASDADTWFVITPQRLRILLAGGDA